MVTDAVARIVVPLFVPATRLDRVAKAVTSGADAIIIDLEDAVAAGEKTAARQAMSGFVLPSLPVIVRVNGVGTPWHQDDLALARSMGVCAVMLPKCEDAGVISAVVGATGGHPILALVESARGVANLTAIASVDGVSRVAFGSVDFSADINCAHESEPLLFARAQIVIASRVAGLTAPIDGVTLAIDDDAVIEADARRAASLGFSGKLCIHPRQVAIVARGFSPSPSERAWAAKVVAAAGDGATTVDGVMIDAPVRRRAEQILRRSSLTDMC